MLCTLGRMGNPTRGGINGIDLMEHPLHVTYFFLKFLILFIYFWLHCVFIAACRLFSSCGEQGPLSSRGSHCGSFSCCGAWVLGCLGSSAWHMGSVALWHMESFWTEIKPVSSALAGGFLTTGPPGKSCTLLKSCNPLEQPHEVRTASRILQMRKL